MFDQVLFRMEFVHEIQHCKENNETKEIFLIRVDSSTGNQHLLFQFSQWWSRVNRLAPLEFRIFGTIIFPEPNPAATPFYKIKSLMN